MKIVSKIFTKTVLVAVAAFGALMSSCTDYLTIIPANMVVEEEFWKSKDQVNGMLATSYLKLLSTDAVSKAIVWGELRSDDMMHQSTPDPHIKNILEANIDDENTYCKWGVYYEAISNANLVLESAEQVMDSDPDFTQGDLDVVKGEMYAMRALCHFYVLRTFRDIPLALKSAKNDAEIPEYIQVHPLEALDLIMEDLDRAEKLVMKSGAFSTREQNLGRITKNAVLAIKADVNLWRAAFATYYKGTEYELVHSDGTVYVQPNIAQTYYDECVQNCSTLIANMDFALEEENKGKPAVEKFAFNLIQNSGETKDKDHISTAYDDIFGSGNSSESIFELQVDDKLSGYAKGAYNLYGTDGKPGLVIAPKSFISKYGENDLRAYSYTNYVPNSNSVLCVAKYAAKGSPAKNYRTSDDWDANWILYRRTDVLLMMAEARVARESANEEDYKKAFEIVRAINIRSQIDTTQNELVEADYLTKSSSIELVRKERMLELAYEGKRWYDLVRMALIEGNTNNIRNTVTEKFDGSTGAVVKAKMGTIDGLFMPIHVEELRFNKNLKQNPAYDKDDSKTEMVK